MHEISQLDGEMDSRGPLYAMVTIIDNNEFICSMLQNC
jgi:hypothetical protein